MQPATSQKRRYTIEDYISPNRANPMIKNFNNRDKPITCVCDPKDTAGYACFKCKSFFHACIASAPNRGEVYQCLPCLNLALDPQVQVRKVLVESFLKTFNIFDYVNIFNFEFTLGQEDLGHMVEVRGLVPDNTSLTWPMQGAFYLNEQKNSMHDLKPLLANSNRKHRREEYFTIPTTGLKAGKNIITFKIPCLDRGKFTMKYQFEDRKVYFMAINSVERLDPADLETQTFRERRFEQLDSIRLLKSNNSEIEVLSNKVCLVCPYTRERIKVPVRGRYCKHFSCICLQTLIASHSASRYWGCPICELKINEPYVDVWIYNMLKDNQLGSEVIVKENGTYEWVKTSKTATMSLDSDDDSPPMKLPVPPPKPAPVAPKPKVISQVKVELKAPEPKKPVVKEPVVVTKVPVVVKEPVIVKEPQAKKDVPPVDIISIDDDESDTPKRKESQAKRQTLKKMKEKMKEIKPIIKPPERQENSQTKRKQDRPLEKPHPQVPDIKTIECKEMKAQQFKRLYFNSKGRVNPYRKYIQNEQFKRLFKEII